MLNIDPHRPKRSAVHPRDTDDESWSFIPVIVCVAALCLVLFFLSPTIDNQSNGARSARPGTATRTTENTSTTGPARPGPDMNTAPQPTTPPSTAPAPATKP
jgi:hypothetical protein